MRKPRTNMRGEEELVNGDSGYIGTDIRVDSILKIKNEKRIKYYTNRRLS